MSRLTDTQLVILSAAAQREEGTLLPLPASLSLNKGAARVVFESLLKRGFVVERPTHYGEEAWREVESVRQTLVITDAGLEAIGVEAGNADTATEELECAANASAMPEAGNAVARDPRGELAAADNVETNITPTVRPGTKLACLIDLMEREEGVTIAEAVEAIGWQAHSVRGAISGNLKKKLGFAITSETVEGRGRVYRIAGKA
ncbi:DUF3489 domain-containing protein [Stappia sp. GBMRC 2046]|uniref:DUF3489 domain-containing protein n=1 Tax=Stappia sediminis TaxID=2692190 RepID=A0A7X3LWP6_9HYPH|nr:DUF3489 domain-containing protein [Stappia sediminis]MXN66500.1 DUF3489 domain-containing protein [Stappia sediminis]